MSENSAASQAGASGPADDPDATRAGAPGDADETIAPDMAPTAGAFDTLGAFDTAAPAPDGTTTGQEAAEDDAAGEDGTVPAARGSLLARIPGERRHWMLAGMVAGGVLLGGLASGGVAWKMISSRNAEVEARTAKLDLQSSRLAEQENRIEVLTRAVRERPLPDDTPAGSPAEAPAAKPAELATPAAKAAELAAPAAKAAELPAPVAKPAAPPAPAAKAEEPPAPRAEPVSRPSPPAGATAGVPPAVAGSGICDVPGGSAGAAQMLKCIEWFAGRSNPPAKPPAP
ncbi:MAG: hypothetical protein K2W80_15550 [Burkholderiales bacterium]|nr:hypothetical protein [Burkholderiales bacterium]